MEIPIVEARDRYLVKHGQIEGFKSLKFSELFNGVGKWELVIPAEHYLLDVLKTKGSGVLIHYGGRTSSGRMTSAVLNQSPNDDETPLGLWTITGLFDSERLLARTILPDPFVEPDAQAVARFDISGKFETVAKALVRLNAGIGALPRRRGVIVAPDLARGNTVSVSARLKTLLVELAERAVIGGLGFTVSQVGQELVFDVYEPVDRSQYVRMDVWNGGLEASGWGYSAPSATEVLVLGQGEGADRQIEVVTTPEAEVEADAWGLRYEVVKDQRNTDVEAELLQAGLEVLAEQGSTIESVRVVPAEAPAMTVGKDWWLGDRVTVSADGQDMTAIVTQVTVAVDSRGVQVQAVIGDPVGFSFEHKQAAKVKEQAARIDVLERNAESGSGLPAPDSSGLVLASDTALKPEWVNPDYRVVADITARDAIVSPKNGMKVFVQSDGREYVWGGSWKPYRRIATGSYPYPSVLGVNGIAQTTITLPVGLFSTAPEIRLMNIGTIRATLSVGSITSSSFILAFANWSNAAAPANEVVVSWVAEQL